MATAPSSPAAPTSPQPRPSSRWKIAVAAIVVVVVLVVAGTLTYFYVLKPSSNNSATSQAGGFTQGSVVTFAYTGSFSCTPGLLSFYPTQTAANAQTSCEVGSASQTAVAGQLPEYVLVPAFAGLSIFGVTALNASARGFPMFAGSALLTDCGAGGTPTGCADHPTYIYSPLFTQVEQHINILNGYAGLPEGVLPTPSHDHLLNTSTTVPNIPWGTIVVLVFDPNIWPNRATGQCSVTVSSNLSNPAGNCLTSIGALDAALGTQASSVATANGKNPIWQTLADPSVQVVVPGDLTIGEINLLNSNLYIPFSVSPGAPSSFPT